MEVDGFAKGVDTLGVGARGRSLDGEYGVDDRGGERGSEGGVEFGGERGVGDGDQGGTVDLAGDLEFVQELNVVVVVASVVDVVMSDVGIFHEPSQVARGTHLQRLLLGDIETLTDDPRMHTLRDVPIGLFQEFTDEEDDRGGPIPTLLVLGDRRPCDHRRRRVLDLHLGQEDLAVLSHGGQAGVSLVGRDG